MSTNGKDSKDIYQYDKPHPGESLDAYMRRHRIHPEDDNPRQATDDEVAEVDKTDDYLNHGFTISKK